MPYRHLILSIGLAFSFTTLSNAATLPTEFESPVRQIDPLSAYFGGVANITIVPSNHVAYSGVSNEIQIMWQHDQFFSSAGAVVGDRLVSGSSLNVPANASTFSVSVQAPATGTISLTIVLLEDDDNDGIIDPLASDDEWTSPRVFLQPGRAEYNFTLTDFVDTNVGGDGIQEFSTTGAMGFKLVFETDTLYPGGVVESPATYFVDHLGLFNSPQSLPLSTRTDLNLDGTVNGSDLGAFLGAWGPCPGVCASDFNSDNVVDGSDLGLLLANWGTIQ